jgi:hypothetical protein
MTPTVGAMNHHLVFFSNPYFPFIASLTLGVFTWLLLTLVLTLQTQQRKEKLTLILSSFWVVVFIFFFLKHLPWVEKYPKSFDGGGLFVAFVLSAYITRGLGQRDLVRLIGLLSIAFLLGDFIQFKKLTASSSQPQNPGKVSANTQSILHIVLDSFSFENAALNNPAFLEKSRILAKQHNLTFYTNHFSNYPATVYSVPDFFKNDTKKKSSVGFKELNTNTLFHHFFEKGYQIYIYGHYLPYCLRFKSLSHHCQINSSTEANISFELSKWIELYFTEFSAALTRFITTNHPYLFISRYPENALQLLEDFKRDFNSFSKSDIPFYAYIHIVLPHTPFLLGADCEKISEPFRSNAPEEELRKRLQSQSLCSLKQLDQLLTVVKSTYPYPLKLLIHSDHGTVIKSDRKQLLNAPSHSQLNELAHVPAWISREAATSPYQIDRITSNQDIGAFLKGSTTELPPKTKLEFYLKYQDKLKRFERIANQEWKLADETIQKD